METKYKLVVFDLDGVLLKIKSSWEHVHDYFNIPPSLREKNLEDYITGKIDYNEWIRRDVELWTKALGRRPSIKDLEKALDNIILNTEAYNAVVELRKQGVILGILSAGIGQAARRAKEALKLDFYLANDIAFDKEGLLSPNQQATVPPFQKPLILTWLAKKYNIPLTNVAYIGDSTWDIGVMRIAGCGIAYNYDDVLLIKYADKVIDNLEELPIVLKKC